MWKSEEVREMNMTNNETVEWGHWSLDGFILPRSPGNWLHIFLLGDFLKTKGHTINRQLSSFLENSISSIFRFLMHCRFTTSVNDIDFDGEFDRNRFDLMRNEDYISKSVSL